MTLWIIVALIVLGLIMLGAELFMPGAILGIVGGIVLLTAVAITYSTYSFMAGTLLLCGLAVAAMIAFGIWLRAFPRSRMGKKVALDSAIQGSSARPGLMDLIGKEGVAHTPLRPSGVAVVEGARVDVITEGEFISPGAPVTVTRVDGAAVFVRTAA